jgi:hypothetical protein
VYLFKNKKHSSGLCIYKKRNTTEKKRKKKGKKGKKKDA